MRRDPNHTAPSEADDSLCAGNLNNAPKRGAATPGDARPDFTTIARLRCLFEAEPELILAFLEPTDESATPTIGTVLSAARAAAAAHPCFADLQCFAAQAAFAAGETAEADRLARRALELNPDYHDALVLATRIAHALAAPRRAIALLRQALAAGADYADVHLLLGDLHRDLGEQQPAANAYRRALEINAGLDAARAGLATPTRQGDVVGESDESSQSGGEEA